jgi:hypothetical protein
MMGKPGPGRRILALGVMAGLVLALAACSGKSTPPAATSAGRSAHQQGMLKLPAGVRTLAQVSVTRR